MLKLENISLTFNPGTVNEKKALTNLSLHLHKGDFVTILGSNGAGKSTLFNTIAGTYTPDSGKVLYDGRDMVTITKKERLLLRREMGMLFQSAALFDSMSVLENVMFPLDMFSDMNSDDRLKRARFCLERVNMLDAQYKSPSELSGGMQKRAAIARAIALEPRYLFCDEPNSGLDPQTSLIIDELIHNITEEYNITTIVNTHDMNSVMGIGDYIIFLAGGHKSWEGTKDDILHTDNKQLNEFLFSSDLLRKVKKSGK